MPTIAIPSNRTNTGNWARSDHEKAETFAEHLLSVFSPLFSLQDDETDIEIKAYLDSVC